MRRLCLMPRATKRPSACGTRISRGWKSPASGTSLAIDGCHHCWSFCFDPGDEPGVVLAGNVLAREDHAHRFLEFGRVSADKCRRDRARRFNKQTLIVENLF